MDRYKEKVIQLREELREVESNSQAMNRDLSQLVTVKETEVTKLLKEIEQVCFAFEYITTQLKKDKDQLEQSTSNQSSEDAKIAAGWFYNPSSYWYRSYT